MRSFISIFLGLFGLLSHIAAHDCCGSSHKGVIALSNQTVDSVQLHGIFKFNQAHVIGSVRIEGLAQGEHLSCYDYYCKGSSIISGFKAENLSHHGLLILNDFNVAQTINIIGLGLLSKGHVKNINAYADQSSSVKKDFIIVLDNIIVQGNVHLLGAEQSLDNQPYCIKISGNSVIEGDVIFDAPGIIEMFPGCSISGQIHNAQVVVIDRSDKS